MNGNTINILEDELKRAKIRREISYRVCDEADTAERTLRRRLEEAKRNNEPQEVIDTMNGDLEKASAITTEARAMLAQADELCMITLKSFAEVRDTHKFYKRRKTTKQEKSPFEIAIEIALIAFIYGAMLLSFVYVLKTYFIAQPTNTTMHQPEPTELYVDSLVCPD